MPNVQALQSLKHRHFPVHVVKLGLFNTIQNVMIYMKRYTASLLAKMIISKT